MPIFSGLETNGRPDYSQTGLYQANRAAPATLYSLHFMEKFGVNFGAQWGRLLRGYEELSMPGYEGTVVNPTATDNFSGWAPPIVIGRTPTPRDVVIFSDPTDAVHESILDAGLNERFEFRHVMAPPRMHLIHSVDVIQNLTGGTMTREQGWRDTVQATPYFPPVRVPGAYYESQSYTASPGADYPVTLRLIGGSHTISDSTPPATITIEIPETGAATIESGGTLTSSDGFDLQAMLYIPGIGYAISQKVTGTASVNVTSFTLTGESALTQAQRQNPSVIYLAIWEYEDDRGVLTT